MPQGGGPPQDENDLPGSVAILAATMNFRSETCLSTESAGRDARAPRDFQGTEKQHDIGGRVNAQH